MLSALADMQNRRTLQVMAFLAVLAMFLPIGLQLIGEEGVFALSSYEMFLRGDFWQETLYGAYHQRPPLHNWLIIATASGIGWNHVDIAIRLVSIAASIGTAALAGLFVRRLLPQKNAGWLAALIYLTLGETMFWYGWLGYADATFAFFIFGMSASLWLAIQGEHMRWYVAAIFMLICAVLTKAMTAYVFFAFTALAVAYGLQRWRFILRPLPVLLFAASLLTPWLWGYASGGTSSHAAGLLHDISQKFEHFDMAAYMTHLASFPLHNATRVLPLGLLIAWLAFRHQISVRGQPIHTILLIIALNYLPYWFAPESSMRYVIIFYGWVALAFTCWIASARPEYQRAAMIIMVCTIVLKVPYSFWILPQVKEAGPHRDQRAVARDILKIAGDKPVRGANNAAEGLAVGTYINMITDDGQFVRNPQPQDRDVFVFTYGPHASYGEPVKTYKLHKTPIYLYHLR